MRVKRPFGLAAASLVVVLGAAGAQPIPPGSIPGGPPGLRGAQVPVQGGSVCARLESALQQIDYGSTGDPETLRRYDDAINRQRFELDQAVMQSRRMGCESRGGFFLFGSFQRSPQCDQLTSQIGRMRANLDRMMGELERMRGGDVSRDTRRRQLIAALAQNNCGPQYRAAAAPQPARPRSLFESLFGGPIREEASPEADPLQLPASGTYRTACVRVCDGFYFPISYATTPAKFPEDEKTCQRLCPAAETALYTHRNPGEEMDLAVSLSGQPYSALPTAFRYRQQFDPACSCRAPGQSWAEALTGRRDETLMPGDVVVTPERSKLMSQPKLTPAQRKKGLRPSEPEPTATITPSQPPGPAVTPTDDRKVRVVGPQFYPVR
jgi:hypothetical protein